MAKILRVVKVNTEANSAPVITRTGSKFTASWKIKHSQGLRAQSVKYRTHNGSKWSKWTETSIGQRATSYSFTLDASKKITKIEVATQATGVSIHHGLTQKECSASSWATGTFLVTIPPAPSLSMSKDSANKTTFTWSISASSTNTAWYDHCLYRTRHTSSSWSSWAVASSSSYTYTDNTAGTRKFQIKAVGPAGESSVKTLKHVIGAPPAATWGSKPVSYTKKDSYYAMTYNINLSGTEDTIDEIVPQYYIGSPNASMGPGSNSFTDGVAYDFKNGKSSYALPINTSELIDLDECLWARVKTTHDGTPALSSAYRVLTGRLTAPTCNISMGTISASGFSVTVNVTSAGTSVPGAYQKVYLERNSKPGEANYIPLGDIPNGTSQKTFNSTQNLTRETGYAIHVRNVSADGKSMTSAYDSYKSSMPMAPVLDSVSHTTVSGKVYLSWQNKWSAATGAVIAWTDDPDNWMSNDAPETFEISELVKNWYITGLETGKTWYFKVRSMKVEGDEVNYSGWSNQVEIDLSSAPAVPVLYLSEETITDEGMVTAYWSYVTTDGTPQISGNVVEATLSNGSWTYGRTVGATTTAQHVDIYAKNQGWTNGSVKYLALQTRSGSGGQSEYSTPVKLVIAAKPTVAITSMSLIASETLTEYFVGDGSNKVFECAYDLSGTPTVKVNGSTRSATYSGSTVTCATAPADGATVEITYSTTANAILDEMPFTALVTATNAASLTLAIERAETYPMIGPDETETDGAAGETIYVSTISPDTGTASAFSVSVADLIGRLDDGAFYNVVATVTDECGQTAEATERFKVHWSHQAWIPSATFETDEEEYIVRITPVATEDYASGDTCDIYRLGIDQPELIYSGAAFGETYVDPYPAFGEVSGYKVVTVTANNDYITEDNTFAEYNTLYVDEAYEQLDTQLLVIDFGGDRIDLPYNLSFDNSWSKDFQRTAYLGGHVAGDHNKAVTRDLSAGTVIARKLDMESMTVLRRLARYAGICHVRTPEGSSFAADVQVSESMSFDSGLGTYSLTIQKVDTVGYDGMTEAEWNKINPEEE